MTAQLNHTVVWCKDKARSSAFLCDVLGLPDAKPFSHFLVSEAEFDAGFGMVQQRGLTSWADPVREKPGEINHHWGGRGVYFEEPDGHLLELITKPYGAMDDL